MPLAKACLCLEQTQTPMRTHDVKRRIGICDRSLSAFFVPNLVFVFASDTEESVSYRKFAQTTVVLWDVRMCQMHVSYLNSSKVKTIMTTENDTHVSNEKELVLLDNHFRCVCVWTQHFCICVRQIVCPRAKTVCPNTDTNTKLLYLCPIFASLRKQTQTQILFFGETLEFVFEKPSLRLGLNAKL